MRRLRFPALRWLAAATLAAAIPLTAAQITTPPAHAAAASGSTQLRVCRNVSIPVALAPGQSARWRIAAEYCTPHGRHVPAVDVLVPGATYNRAYYDLPLDRPEYSYVDRALAAGRATLDIDRLGTGASSHPLPAEITLAASAYALHQVITWERQQEGYGQVDLIGHSLGSAVADAEAGTWPSDADRIVLTGLLFAPRSNFTALLTGFVPAPQHPGDYTTPPGQRAHLFYDTATADPAVINWDEQHKDVVPAAELYTAPSVMVPAFSSRITAPVYLLVGARDMMFCGGAGITNCADPASVLAYERPYFPRAASLAYGSVPRTGHDWALSTTAGTAFRMINNWFRSHPVPPAGREAP